MMVKIKSFNHSTDGWEHYGNVIGFDMVNQYLCAVKEVMGNQRDNSRTTLRNEDLMTDRVKQLLDMVQAKK